MSLLRVSFSPCSVDCRRCLTYFFARKALLLEDKGPQSLPFLSWFTSLHSAFLAHVKSCDFVWHRIFRVLSPPPPPFLSLSSSSRLLETALAPFSLSMDLASVPFPALSNDNLFSFIRPSLWPPYLGCFRWRLLPNMESTLGAPLGGCLPPPLRSRLVLTRVGRCI